MEYFHRRNIAHRDIKLENTLLQVGLLYICSDTFQGHNALCEKGLLMPINWHPGLDATGCTRPGDTKGLNVMFSPTLRNAHHAVWHQWRGLKLTSGLLAWLNNQQAQQQPQPGLLGALSMVGWGLPPGSTTWRISNHQPVSRTPAVMCH